MNKLRNYNLLLCLGLFMTSCNQKPASEVKTTNDSNAIELIVLGTVQDGGSPHLGCAKPCCADGYYADRKVVSLGITNHSDSRSYMLEASPDFISQYSRLLSSDSGTTLSGVFLTHAHIGHYTGLMYLGREALGASKVPVYAMPRMQSFLKNNGPWSQLVHLDNIELRQLKKDSAIQLGRLLNIKPIRVPHRDEFSETVGYNIHGPNKKVLFIPDIDKWSKWEKDILQEVGKVDIAFIDATFYSGKEINHRDISEIPHPFVIETMALFDSMPQSERNKIHFIHLNHTNPLLDATSTEYKRVIEKGYHVARIHQRIAL